MDLLMFKDRQYSHRILIPFKYASKDAEFQPSVLYFALWLLNSLLTYFYTLRFIKKYRIAQNA